MVQTTNRLAEILAKIATEANDALAEDEDSPNGVQSDGDGLVAGSSQQAFIACAPKVLPKRLLMKAAATAAEVNPVNRPYLGATQASMGLSVMEPQRIALLTAKYWGPAPRQLSVSFLEATPADLRARIVGHMNAWTKTGCISFAETSGIGDVRISRGPGGYYSYLGTDILHIPKNRQTMNLQNFTMATPESEYHRVVRHETGHTLGLVHEHMREHIVARIDRTKAYAYFLRTQGWDKATVDQQVLTPLDEGTLTATPVDQASIMCYQLPASITRDGKPIIGGLDINAADFAFIGKVYPRTTNAPAPDQDGDWSESEDVDVTI